MTSMMDQDAPLKPPASTIITYEVEYLMPSGGATEWVANAWDYTEIEDAHDRVKQLTDRGYTTRVIEVVTSRREI